MLSVVVKLRRSYWKRQSRFSAVDSSPVGLFLTCFYRVLPVSVHL